MLKVALASPMLVQAAVALRHCMSTPSYLSLSSRPRAALELTWAAVSPCLMAHRAGCLAIPFNTKSKLGVQTMEGLKQPRLEDAACQQYVV